MTFSLTENETVDGVSKLPIDISFCGFFIPNQKSFVQELSHWEEPSCWRLFLSSWAKEGELVGLVTGSSY